MPIRELREGMRGEDVRALQKGLNLYFRGKNVRVKRHSLAPDGAFGRHTRHAVETFQEAHPGTGKPDGSPDGVVGRRSRRTLFNLAAVTFTLVGFTNESKQSSDNLQLDFNPCGWPIPEKYSLQHFPGLMMPVAVPDLRNTPATLAPLFQLPPLSGAPPLSLVFDQVQVSASSQIALQKQRKFGTLQPLSVAVTGVVDIGDPDAKHMELATGSQLSLPSLDGSISTSYLWYAQLTDVDRFGKLGHFHWWEPLAQAGLQYTPGTLTPSLSFFLSPLNVAYEAGAFSFNVGLGLAATYDPSRGVISASLLATSGLSITLPNFM